jgi:hypothetical protein
MEGEGEGNSVRNCYDRRRSVRIERSRDQCAQYGHLLRAGHIFHQRGETHHDTD